MSESELTEGELKAWKSLRDEGVSWQEFIEALPKLRAEAKKRKEREQKILEKYEIRKGSKLREKKETVTEQAILKKRMDILERKERVIAGVERELEKLQSESDEWKRKTGIEFKQGLNIIRDTDQDNLLLLFNNSPHSIVLESINEEEFNIMLKPYECKSLETKKHWGKDEKMHIKSSTIFRSKDEDEPTGNGGE